MDALNIEFREIYVIYVHLLVAPLCAIYKMVSSFTILLKINVCDIVYLYRSRLLLVLDSSCFLFFFFLKFSPAGYNTYFLPCIIQGNSSII